MLMLLSMSFDPPHKAIRINAIAVIDADATIYVIWPPPPPHKAIRINAIAVIDADATIYVIWPPT